MLPCTDCRPLILDHLFGLLDAPEAAAVEAHLASCPACTAARDEAAKMQGLIAKAAKSQFPTVRFDAPVAKPGKAAARPAVAQLAVLAPASAAEARGASPASAGRSLRVAVWLPWVVAVAVLIAIPGTVVPVLGVLDRAETARRDAEASTAKVTATLTDLEKAEQAANKKQSDAALRLASARQVPENILAKWMEDEKAAVEMQNAPAGLNWNVRKPAAIQPGAPNEFLLVLRDRDGTSTGQVVAEVRDQTDAVIYSQPIEAGKRHDHTVRLPASVWTKLTPQSELFLTVASVDTKTQKKTELQERVRLLGPVFTTVLTTDKPAYRPGETVFFRSLTLDRTSFTPPTREQVFRYELHNPHGHPVRAGVISGGTELARVTNDAVEPIRGPDGKPLRGVGAGAITVPTDAADGDYTLVLRELPHAAGYPAAVPLPVTRAVKVRSGVTEAYHKEVGYAAASYVAGDTVEALVELKFREQPADGVEVHAVATADDQVLRVLAAEPKTDARGKARLRFTLPPELERGDVRLQVTFRTRAGDEVVAERVPVVGRNVGVEFFPEGGELVAGVPCRVYFRATTPGGLPVDVAGVITDGRKVLAEVKTVTDEAEKGVNRGIGSFTFTPELGIPVWLKLATPTATYAPLLPPDRRQFAVVPAALVGSAAVIGSRTGFLLPEAAKAGVVMTIPDPVTAPGEPIRVHLQSVARPRNLVVGAYTRGRLSDTQKVTVATGQVAEVRLMGGADPRGGVVRVTVFEEPAEVVGQPTPDLKPVAERLVFRKPGELLNLDLAMSGVAGNGAGYAPGSSVNLGITATTDKEKRNPAAAILYAAVVNTAVASSPKDRLLTTHFLIAGEVNTPDAMEYADFLLGEHPRAAETLDLVLATQGWRRFAEQTPEGYAKRPVAPSAECANLMVCNGQYTVWAEPPSAKEHRRLFEAYWPRYEAAVKKLDAVRAATEAAKVDRSDDERVRELATKAKLAREEAIAQANRAEEAADPVARLRGAGWYAVAGFGLLALLLGAASLTRSTGRLPLGIGTMGSLGLVAFLVFALGTADRTHAAGQPLPAERFETGPQPREADGKRSGADSVVPTASSDAKGAEAGPGRGGLPGVKAAKGDDVLGSGFNAGRPKMPNAPKTDKYPPAPGGVFGAPGGGGFGGAGGGIAVSPPSVGSTEPANPVGGPPNTRPGMSYWSPPQNPWFPAPPIKPADPKGSPTPGGSRKHDFGHKLAAGDGWQPGGKKPIQDVNLDERKLFEMWLRDQTKDARAMLVTPALPVGVAALAPPKPVVATGVVPDAATDRPATVEPEVYFHAVERARLEFAERAKLVQAQIEEGLGRLDLKQAQPSRAESGVARMQAAELPSDAIALNRIRAAVPQVAPLVVREYAAPRPGSGEAGSRAESDTVLWQPVIVLPSDGKTTLTFNVGGAKGGYEVVVAGHTLDGRIGAVRTIIPVAHPEPTTTPSPVPPPAPGGPDKR